MARPKQYNIKRKNLFQVCSLFFLFYFKKINNVNTAFLVGPGERGFQRLTGHRKESDQNLTPAGLEPMKFQRVKRSTTWATTLCHAMQRKNAQGIVLKRSIVPSGQNDTIWWQCTSMSENGEQWKKYILTSTRMRHLCKLSEKKTSERNATSLESSGTL